MEPVPAESVAGIALLVTENAAPAAFGVIVPTLGIAAI
jgi:hypothetical protein